LHLSFHSLVIFTYIVASCKEEDTLKDFSGLQMVSILPEPNLQPYDIPEVDEETRQQLLTLREHMDALINMVHY
jgi:hypothetical protein